MAQPSFCVILPMYNEASGAESCVRGISDFLSTLKVKTGIVAVDDGSKDETAKVLMSLKNSIPNLVVEIHSKNSGYGAANRTGFKAAIRDGFDYALVMDGDGTQDPKYISNFLKPMQESFDFIKGSRYCKNGRAEGVPFKRRAVSWFGNKLAKIAFRLPISDYTNGFRAIKTSLLKNLETTETGFAVLVEEVNKAKKLGANFIEVPYTLRVRKIEGSLSKFVYSLRVYRTYLKYLV